MPRKRGRALADVRDAMLGASEKERSYEEREHMPDIACGLCKNFFQAGLGTTGGMCKVLKKGTDITAEPPVFTQEGETLYPVNFNMESSKCTFFDKMEIVETDATQSHDPMVSRHQRQMAK